MPRKKKTKTVNVVSDSDDTYDSSNASSDSEDGDAEQLLNAGCLSASQKSTLQELLQRQKAAKVQQEQAKAQAVQEKARKKILKLEKKFGAAAKACVDSDTESLPDVRTRTNRTAQPANLPEARPTAVASTSGSTSSHDNQAARMVAKSRKKVVSSKSTRSSPRGAAAARTSPRRLYTVNNNMNRAAASSPITPPLAQPPSSRKRRRVRTPRTPRSSAKKSRYVPWLSSESDGEERNPNWEPEEIRAIYLTAMDFRSDVLNEFDNNDSQAVRHTRRARAFRAIQEAVNSVGGNNRRATHILRKMRDFKSKTKMKNAQIMSQARELAVTAGQTGGKPAEPEDQLDEEEILCLDFYGVEHYSAIPGAVIRPVDNSDEDSDAAHAQMDDGVRKQQAATESYNQAKRQEKKSQADKYGFKPIRLVPDGDGGTKIKEEPTTSKNTDMSSGARNMETPTKQPIRTPPTRSSERLAARQQRQSIGEELDRLWPQRETPRRGLTFDRLENGDGELATPLSGACSPPAGSAHSTPAQPHVPFSSFRDCLKNKDDKKTAGKNKGSRKREEKPDADNRVIVVDSPESVKGGVAREKEDSNRPERVVESGSKGQGTDSSKRAKSGANAAVPHNSCAQLTEAALSRFEKKLDEVVGAVTVTQSHMTAMDERTVSAETVKCLWDTMPDVSAYEKKLDELSKLVESTAAQVSTIETESVSQDTVEELVRCMRSLTSLNSKMDDIGAFVRVTHSQMQKLDKKIDDLSEKVAGSVQKCEEVKTIVNAQGCRTSVMGNRVANIEKLTDSLNKAADTNPTNGDLADRIEAVEATCLSLKDSLDTVLNNETGKLEAVVRTEGGEKQQSNGPVSTPHVPTTAGAAAPGTNLPGADQAEEDEEVTFAHMKVSEGAVEHAAATTGAGANSDTEIETESGQSPKKRMKVQLPTTATPKKRGARGGKHKRK